jgi:hypothetical protein
MTIRDQIVPVEVTDRGIFQARVDGNEYRESSYEGLRDHLMRATRRAAVKVAVPFTQILPGRFSGSQPVVRHGVATGIHAARNVALVRWEDGRAGEVKSLTVMRRLNDVEAADYLALMQAANEATKALREYERPRILLLRQAVEVAIREATDKEEASS